MSCRWEYINTIAIWADTPTSHLSLLDSVEYKAHNIIRISHDEAEAQGLLLSHITDRSVVCGFTASSPILLALLSQSSDPPQQQHGVTPSWLNFQHTAWHTSTPLFLASPIDGTNFQRPLFLAPPSGASSRQCMAPRVTPKPDPWSLLPPITPSNTTLLLAGFSILLHPISAPLSISSSSSIEKNISLPDRHGYNRPTGLMLRKIEVGMFASTGLQTDL